MQYSICNAICNLFISEDIYFIKIQFSKHFVLYYIIQQLLISAVSHRKRMIFAGPQFYILRSITFMWYARLFIKVIFFKIITDGQIASFVFWNYLILFKKSTQFMAKKNLFCVLGKATCDVLSVRIIQLGISDGY